MSLAITAITVGSATAGLMALQYDAQRDALKAQQRAQDEATRQARLQAQQAERDFNRVNQKRPNVAAMMGANAAAASGGVGSTMLTGPQGVDTSTMRLGRTTLLGA